MNIPINEEKFKNSSSEHEYRIHTRSSSRDDPIITKAIMSVNNMIAPPPGTKIKGSGVMNSPAVISSKKIKVTQQIIESAYKKLKEIVKDDKPNVDNIVVTVAYAMQISNEMITTSKTYKVELALSILRKLIDSEIDDPTQRAVLHMLIESTIPALIDTISGLPGMVSRAFGGCCKSEKKKSK